MNLNFGSMRNSTVVWVFVVIAAGATFGGVTRSKTNGARPPKADTVLAAAVPTQAARVERNPDREAYFGETHLHTSWSLDAWVFGNRLTGPDDAYKYAQGQTIKHPLGYDIHIETPLDFMGVTDHSEYVGVTKQANTPGSYTSKLPAAQALILRTRTTQPMSRVSSSLFSSS